MTSYLIIVCVPVIFKDDVLFTYERDDGLCRSWIDHVLCSQSFSSTISNVRAVHSGSILSDHFPLLFTLEANNLPVNYTEPVSSKKLHRIDWTRVTHNNIDKYCSLVSQRISVLPSDIMDCSVPDCSSHHNALHKRRNTVFSTGALIARLGSRATPSQSATCGVQHAVVGEELSAPATFPRRFAGETHLVIRFFEL